MATIPGGHNVTHYDCCSTQQNELMEAVTLAAEIPDGFGSYMEKVIRDTWEKQALQAGFSPELVKVYGQRLSEAVTKGYGKNLLRIKWDDPDREMLRNLHIDAWKFASAKGNAQLEELSGALIKPDGTMRTFEEFRIQSVIITGKHLRGLKAEYNTAVASAQMASKWKTIQEQKDVLPYLEFMAVEDGHTTALCRSLDGVIRHVDDPFWSRYYPPNHYNCRSTVRQLPKGEDTPDDDITHPDTPEEFMINLARTGVLFPPDHAYLRNMPARVLDHYRQFFPELLQFDRMDIGEAKGMVLRHFLVQTGSGDYDRNLELAVDMARQHSQIIRIMPTLNPTQYKGEIRDIIFPDAKKDKSPDLRINKTLWEEERSTNSGSINNIKHAIGAGSKQADHVIISLSQEVDEPTLSRIVKSRWKDHKNLKEIVFRFLRKEWRYKRP